MNQPKFALLSITIMLAMASCSHESTSASSNKTEAGVAYLPQSETIDNVVSTTVQVLDDATGAPITDALVRVLCSGGTPFQDSQDLSDMQGQASVNCWNSEFLGVNVERDGYESKSVFIRRMDPVVRLKRQ